MPRKLRRTLLTRAADMCIFAGIAHKEEQMKTGNAKPWNARRKGISPEAQKMVADVFKDSDQKMKDIRTQPARSPLSPEEEKRKEQDLQIFLEKSDRWDKQIAEKMKAENYGQKWALKNPSR